MKIGRGVSELWASLTLPMAYTTACTNVQALIRVAVVPPLLLFRKSDYV